MEPSVMASMRKKVKYSQMEHDLINLLPKKGRSITSSQLVELYYKKKKIRPPFYAQESVSKMMRELIRKVEYNEEDFEIIKTQPRGPHPTAYSKVSRE